MFNWRSSTHMPVGAVPKYLLAAARGWERLEMVERCSHAVPIKDGAALPNPLAHATLVHYPW